MGSEILINVRPNQTRVAYVQNGELSDLKVERIKAPTNVGSVFKGKVMRVLPGMQAAFVDIGLDRAAFLYVGDISGDIDSEKLLAEEVAQENEEEDYEGVLDRTVPEPVDSVPLIQDLLKEGQMILVQVAKDPLGTKGARITTHISIPGRLLVYMPTLDHLGISRRILNESERERLRSSVEALHP
ncbi:MAG: ribonuclease E/G, partial [Bdellovibrionales bacterium]|nr:ribonuclease E/G [Bdellovibrionales bacterium]